METLLLGKYGNADNIISYGKNGTKSNDTFTMGFELEHSYKTKHEQLLVSEDDIGILKTYIASYERDNSLINGWEAVSYPFPVSDWDYIIGILSNWFDVYIKYQKPFGISTKKSGLHIHVNKSPLNRIITYLFEKAIVKEHNSMPYFNYKLYQKTNYADNFFALLMIMSNRDFLKHAILRSDCSNHYRYISCSHYHTIEHRLFKSCITFNELYIRLLFIRSIYDFGRNIDTIKYRRGGLSTVDTCVSMHNDMNGCEDFTYKNYLDYLCDNEIYHDLVNIIINHKKSQIKKRAKYTKIIINNNTEAQYVRNSNI